TRSTRCATGGHGVQRDQSVAQPASSRPASTARAPCAGSVRRGVIVAFEAAARAAPRPTPANGVPAPSALEVFVVCAAAALPVGRRADSLAVVALLVDQHAAQRGHRARLTGAPCIT